MAKTERNIFIAFILNLMFSVLELAGGFITGSTAIISDALHDMGDAASIGIAYFLEKKSKRPPDAAHTYGYGRYSALGGVITTLILLLGSAAVIANAVRRIVSPTPIHYDGMILLAVIGVCVNLAAMFFTREGDSLNQRAVNLHMFEDVLGWVVVLAGGVIMRFTDLAVIDPLMSIGVAVYILIHALQGLGEATELFLEKTPRGLNAEELRTHLCAIDGVADVHHLHVWSIDGVNHAATLHIVTEADPHAVKESVREELAEHGIGHVTVELERPGEHCAALVCAGTSAASGCGHHHHHHHNHHHHHHE